MRTPARLSAAAIAAVALLLAPARGAAREVAGVEVAEAGSAGGKALVLNGAGLRKKVFFKVYVGALYVEARSADAEALVGADAVKQVRLTFLRDVDRKSIIGAFREGFENNSPAAAAELAPRLADLEKVVPEEIKTGQVLVVTYVPGAGSTIGLEGGKSISVEGKAFGDALFRNWLGPKPADADLKAGMLGR